MSVSVSIRIVADCAALSSQVTKKLKRATTLEFTTVPAIIFIHCCVFVLYFSISCWRWRWQRHTLLQFWVCVCGLCELQMCMALCDS